MPSSPELKIWNNALWSGSHIFNVQYIKVYTENDVIKKWSEHRIYVRHWNGAMNVSIWSYSGHAWSYHYLLLLWFFFFFVFVRSFSSKIILNFETMWFDVIIWFVRFSKPCTCIRSMNILVYNVHTVHCTLLLPTVHIFFFFSMKNRFMGCKLSSFFIFLFV